MEGDEGLEPGDLFVRPLPAAHVTLTLVCVELVGVVGPRAVPSSALRARIVLNGRLVGTSRPPGDGALFDLAGEPMAWSREIRVFEGDTIPIEVRLVRLDAVPSLGTVATLSVGVGPPWAEGEQVFDDGVLRLTLSVSTRRVPRPGLPLVVSRSAAGNPTPATLELRNALVVELLDIVGLYEPVDDPAPGELRARRRLAYTGQDDRGRIFTNRWYDGSFERDHQAIELLVRVRAARGFLPATVTLRWLVLDPDDPSNEQAHPDAGPVLDPNDYDAALHELGTASDDNQGTFDRVPRFEAVGAYGLTVVSSTEAHTSVLEGVSRLRVHCPNVAGDNLIVRVEVLIPEGEHFAAETGVLTMWHRFDVEVVRMKRARRLPLDQNARLLETACVQLDFAPERIIRDIPWFGVDKPSYDAVEVPFYRLHAKHRTHPGWFFVGILHRPFPWTEVERWRGVGTLVREPSQCLLRAPVHVPDAKAAVLRWTVGGQPVSTRFSVHSALRRGRLGTDYVLLGVHYMPFLRDGASGPDVFAWPNCHDEGAGLVDGGYHAPEAVEVTLYSGQANFAGNTSWSTGDGRPDGACYAFSTAIEDLGFDWLAPMVVAHEIMHTLSLSHACGRRDAQHEAVCLMHGRYKPLLDLERGDATKPLSFDETLPASPFGSLCEAHIREARHVHVEDIDTYSWIYPPPRRGENP
jgi:hypothetical protein